jgi:ribonuclease J
VGEPNVTTRGFVTDRSTEALLDEIPDIVNEVMRSASRDERTDRGVVQEQIRLSVQRVIRKGSGRRPLVLPVIMEI